MMTLTRLPLLAAALFVSAATASAQVQAIVGATVIDGNGGPPLENATVLVTGSRITAVGPRATMRIPAGAKVLDAVGRFLVPGFIDLNNHITGRGFHEDLFPLVLFGVPNPILTHGYAVEAAQMALKSGVTTIRDTYGPLPPLLEIRDLIAKGTIIGPRLMVAGDIIGWGGPHHGAAPLTPREKLFNAWFQGYADIGVDITTKSPEQVRVAINGYIDKGPDFLKYGATTHSDDPPMHIVFSPRVQKVIVDAAHKRGLKVDVHTGTVEGMLLAAEAGADIITHAGSPGSQPIPDDVIQVLRERKTVCALFSHMTSGPLADALLAMGRSGGGGGGSGSRDSLIRAVWPNRQLGDRLPEYRALVDRWRASNAQRDVAALVLGERANHVKLIRGGCAIAIATDNAPSGLPELAGERAATPFFADPGIGTILAIEGLVGLGMTPGEALVAATRTGAWAAGKLDQFGTIEAGKYADLLLLDGNPLANIANIRTLRWVMKEGRMIDPATLPSQSKYYRR